MLSEEVRLQSPYMVRFIYMNCPEQSKPESRKQTDQSLPGGWAEGTTGAEVNGQEFSFWGDASILKLDNVMAVYPVNTLKTTELYTSIPHFIVLQRHCVCVL